MWGLLKDPFNYICIKENIFTLFLLYIMKT